MAQVDDTSGVAEGGARSPRGAWLHGQNRAFRAALDGAPLETSLGLLIETATVHLGEGARCAFFMGDPAGETPRHVVGMSDSYRGSWSFPVETTAGELVGVFALDFPEPREVRAEDL